MAKSAFKLHIKKGDTVLVLAGDDKGKSGKVLTVYPEKSRAIVEGLNIVSKHRKPTAQNTQGGIVKVEAAIAISNVMLWDAKAKVATKVKRTRESGKLVRVSKKSGNAIK